MAGRGREKASAKKGRTKKAPAKKAPTKRRARPGGEKGKAAARPARKKRGAGKAAASPAPLEPPPGPELLSQRQYADHRKRSGLPGGTHQAVSKAIRDGRLSQSFTKKGRRYLIDPERADEEWASSTDPMQVRDADVIGKARRQAAADAGEEQGLFGPLPAENAPEVTGPTEGLEPGRTVQQSRAYESHYSAELRRMQYEREAGRLCEVEQVDKAVFRVFREARNKMLELPDRIAAQMAAEPDEGACRELMRAEVQTVLEDLSRSLRRE